MSKRSSLEKIVVEKGRTYLGVVEDNNDPDRLCRCRIRVYDVHDGQDEGGDYLIHTENLPWASPWKDLNGNSSTVPDLGKVLIVVFENANPNTPEYISANHYNKNLELKISKDNMAQADYLSMKAILFDHKTQIFVNDSEGLKLDHKFNNINIKDDSININLKDNHDSTVYIGTPGATQRAILGDNFMDWFDKFLDLFVQNSALLGNFFFPAASHPKMLEHIAYYKSIRDPKLLSKHVKIVDNDSVRKQDRLTDSTVGDEWLSTVADNQLTKEEKVDFKPVSGSSDTTFPQTPAEAETKQEPATKEPHPDAKVIIQLLKKKNYKLYTEVSKLNIVAVRKQCLKPGDAYTDEFNDVLYVMYLNEEGDWTVNNYTFSTVPGKDFTATSEIIAERLRVDAISGEALSQLDQYRDAKITIKKYLSLLGEAGVRVIAPSQYLDCFELKEDGLYSRTGSEFNAWFDKDLEKPDFYPESMQKPAKSTDLVKIGKGFPNGKKVGTWSMRGEQCFATNDSFREFLDLCKRHADAHQNSISYTLVTKEDWDEANKNAEINKESPDIDPKKVATLPAAKPKAAEVAKRPAGRPQELPSSTDVKAFQVWANKNGETLKEDGLWGESSKLAWEKRSQKFLKFIGHVSSAEIRLTFARLFPYGGAVKLADGSYTFQSKFNNQKYRLTAYSNGRFSVFDMLLGKATLLGDYEDGFLSITITDDPLGTIGKLPKTLKDKNAWPNIRKLV